MHENVVWSCRLAFLTVLVVVTYFAFTPVTHAGIEEVSDKLRHIAAFYVLALLLDFSTPSSRFAVFKILLLVGYGMAIEVIQYFLPYRHFSLMDMVADAAGILAYMISIPLLIQIPLIRERWQLVRQPPS